MSATTASPSLSKRSATTTALAPSRASSRAVAAPMPPAAPETRATLSFMRMVYAPSSRKLEADDAGNDQADRDETHGRCRIAEGQDADHECAAPPPSSVRRRKAPPRQKTHPPPGGPPPPPAPRPSCSPNSPPIQDGAKPSPLLAQAAPSL